MTAEEVLAMTYAQVERAKRRYEFLAPAGHERNYADMNERYLRERFAAAMGDRDRREQNPCVDVFCECLEAVVREDDRS